MNPERWKKVKGLFDAALALEHAQRQKFLKNACGADDELRLEVENLLVSFDNADSFMDKPAAAEVASLIVERREKLKSGESIAHFEIVRQIGAGGMGEVYLAKDKKLDRRVAVKFLNEKFSRDESNLQRFIQEAKAASALNHPNILVIHEIGESGDTHYIVSEFIEGETLREVAGKSPLKLTEVLDISIQIAGALCTAHEAHIVHRDIKPENIMIRPDGFVKILDFGLAKLIGQRHSLIGLEDETAKQNQTAKGIILGTVKYMSPEQARGEKIDARTDIFSLGVVIYEMVTGRTPFDAESVSETFTKLLNTEPPPLARFASDVPAELQHIVSKILRKDKDARYQTMKGLLADLKDLRETLAFDERLEKSHSSGAENETKQFQTTTDKANKQAAATQHSFSQKIKQHKSAAFVGLATFVIALAVVGYFAFFAASPINSIAVLPFENASGNAETEYLSDGMTETLISSLSQIPKLNVKARSSVFRYKGKETDLQKIAAELNVQAILSGRVAQRGEQLILNLELVDAKTANVIWSEQYNRKQADLISLQTEIARDVSQKLKTKLSGADEQKLTKNYTANPEAYQLYLKGRYHFSKYSKDGFRKGIEFFSQAIIVDPNYALAYSGLADCYFGLSDLHEPPREVMPKARAAAQKAVELDDSLAEAHVSLGLVKMFHDWEWTEAERQFRRAIALNPNYGNAHHFYARYLAWTGQFEEALKESERAVQIEPLSSTFNANLGYFLLLADRNDEAFRQQQKTFELDPNYTVAHLYLGLSYLKQREFEKAVSESEKAAQLSQTARYLGGLGYAYAAAGQREKARRVLEELNKMRERQYVSSYYFAVVYAGLNEKDQAFVWLNKAYSERSDALTSIKVNPWFDNLRDDPRFQDLLRRMNLL